MLMYISLRYLTCICNDFHHTAFYQEGMSGWYMSIPVVFKPKECFFENMLNSNRFISFLLSKGFSISLMIKILTCLDLPQRIITSIFGFFKPQQYYIETIFKESDYNEFKDKIAVISKTLKTRQTCFITPGIVVDDLPRVKPKDVKGWSLGSFIDYIFNGYISNSSISIDYDYNDNEYIWYITQL